MRYGQILLALICGWLLGCTPTMNSPSGSSGKSHQGRVLDILGSDSLSILGADHKSYTVILSGVEGPSPGQPYEGAAREFLRSFALGETVTITPERDEKTVPLVARVRVSGNDLSLRLVQQGFAWVIPGTHANELWDSMLEAKKTKKGLWSLPSAKNPQRFKKFQNAEARYLKLKRGQLIQQSGISIESEDSLFCARQVEAINVVRQMMQDCMNNPNHQTCEAEVRMNAGPIASRCLPSSSDYRKDHRSKYRKNMANFCGELGHQLQNALETYGSCQSSGANCQSQQSAMESLRDQYMQSCE